MDAGTRRIIAGPGSGRSEILGRLALESAEHGGTLVIHASPSTAA